MFAEILKSEKERQESNYNDAVKRHNDYYMGMVKLKKQLEKVGDGLLKLEIKFAEPTKENILNGHLPCLEVVNIKTPIIIRGTINQLRVSGLHTFRLSGEAHNIESFLKKIAVLYT